MKEFIKTVLHTPTQQWMVLSIYKNEGKWAVDVIDVLPHYHNTYVITRAYRNRGMK